MGAKNEQTFGLIYNGYYNSPDDVAEHFHDNTELIFFRRGSCLTCVPGYDPLRCEEHQVCVIPPNLRHAQRDGSADIYTQYVIFAGKSSLNDFRLIDTRQDSVTAHWFADIQQLSQENSLDALQMLLNLLVLRLQKLAMRNPGSGRYPPALLRAVEFMENHYHQTISAAEIVQVSYVSRTCLVELFLRFLGMNISRYLAEIRMYHARQQLCLNYTCNVREIAHQVGYADADYFCRKFKQLYGITPLEYRKFPSHFTSRSEGRRHLYIPLSMQ